jgi:D-beta-D-heptose 7-phosphate kinase / D-beta-D-heptose 1-phosphate adenosyltransferase
MTKKKVLVIGDAILDRYVHGQVERVSPEAPTVVLNVQNEVAAAGGAVNVALNALCNQALVGFIGLRGIVDSEADALQRILDKEGVWHNFLRVGKYCVPTKKRFVANNHQLLRCDTEHSNPLQDRLSQASSLLVDAFHEVIDEVAVLVLSDYDKGTLTEYSAPALIQLARSKGIPVLVAPKGEWWKKYNDPDVLVANWKEALQFRNRLGTPLDLPEGDEKGANLLTELISETARCRNVVVTAGPHGAFWYDSRSVLSIDGTAPRVGSHHKITANRREVGDVTGAGDTFLGVLAAEMWRGTDMAEALVRANAAAGLAVTRAGTARIHRYEVNAELRYTRKGLAKIASLSQARDTFSLYQPHGKRVGFLYGEFHQLKPGHIRFINRASEECDLLVVGVNEDVIKPPATKGGAWQELADRLEVLASVEAVGLVVPIPDGATETVIRDLRPDVLFVTERHALKKPAGIVVDYGGEVVIRSHL